MTTTQIDRTEPVDIAIVGAGPYGLSLGAHLRAAGVPFRQFGRPMQLWREAMPRGMFLKSQGFASNLSDPAGAHTLRAFCESSGRDYADYGLPVPLETFVAYGDWFQRAEVPHLEELMVSDVSRAGRHFDLTLSDGSNALARRVVVATGVQHFAHLPDALAALPVSVCTHSSEHDDLSVFADREVAVVGAGQSALESAALLYESGARVTVLARAARTALGPAGAHWLRCRVEGKIRTLVAHSVRWADPEPWGVRLGLRVNGGGTNEIIADHVLAATGFRTNLDRLTFLDARLRSTVHTLAGSPAVGPDFQSSVPGLYFAGPAVAPTFGPLMRFVYGAAYAARAVTLALASTRDPRITAGARR